MAVAAPAADRRFRRAQVKPSRRRSWRASWPLIVRLIVVLGLVGYGVYRGAAVVFSSDAVTITRIMVTGNSRLSKGEVLALVDDVRGANLLTADLNNWRKRLMSSPWVADASIRRMFPGTIEIAIAERQPLGIGRINDILYLIDQRATVIDEYGPNYSELDLPIIDGLGAASNTGLLVDERRAALAGRVLTELQRRPDLGARVSQIDVTDLHDAVVILKDDTTLVRIGDERFVDRLQMYVDLAPTLRERVPTIDYVDLRFEERVGT